MLWRVLRSNREFIRHFLTAPNEHVFFFPSASFSRLCYVFICQAKVAFALLEALAPADKAAYPSTPETISPEQLVINEVDYPGICQILRDKFHSMKRDPFIGGKEVEFISLMEGTLSTLGTGYARHLQRVKESRKLTMEVARKPSPLSGMQLPRDSKGLSGFRSMVGGCRKLEPSQ